MSEDLSMSIMYKTINFNVRERDVNLNDNIRPATVLDYFQDIAGMHATELGVGFKPMLDLNLYWVILYVEFEKVGKIPHFGEQIKVSTWPKIQSKLEFEREYEIRDLNDNLIIKKNSQFAELHGSVRKTNSSDSISKHRKVQSLKVENYGKYTNRKSSDRS